MQHILSEKGSIYNLKQKKQGCETSYPKPRQNCYTNYTTADGVVGEFLMYPELYAIGKKLDLSKDDLYRYSISLGHRGFLEVQPVLGGRLPT